MERHEYPLGTTFEHNGKTLQVVEDTTHNACEGCHFNDGTDCSNFPCTSDFRSDECDVRYEEYNPNNPAHIRYFVKKGDGIDPNYGWGKAYAVIPPNHPLYDVELSQISRATNRHITFGDFGRNQSWPEILTQESEHYIIGFNPSNLCDSPENSTQSFVFLQAQLLSETLEKIKVHPESNII